VAAVVTDVTPTSLQLALDDGTSEPFLWQGASLMDHFTPGMQVEVGVSGAWSWVEGPVLAMAYDLFGFNKTNPGLMPKSDGLTILLEQVCSWTYAPGACNPPPEPHRAWFVRAEQGGTTIDVPWFGVGTIGAYEIHHFYATSGTAIFGSNCTQEGSFRVAFTVLGPAAPPP